MANDQLTPEEQEILESVENGEWFSVPNLEQEIKCYQSYAKAQLGDLQEIKVELPAQDLKFLKELADHTQTSLPSVITHLLHQFVSLNLENKISNEVQ